MKIRTLITLAFVATSSTLALAQGSSSGSGSSGAAGTSGAAPGGVPSGTGGIGAAPSGGAGVPGGVGPGDTSVRPNIPSMNPTNPTVGRESGDGARAPSPSGAGLSSRPSSLNPPLSGTGSGTSGSQSDPTAPPAGTPRIMVPERR